MDDFRDTGVQVSEESSSVTAGAEAVGVTKTLMEMQSRLMESHASERDAVARMQGLQKEADVASGACKDAEKALETTKLELEVVQKLLEEAVRDKEHAQGAKEKAEERLSRTQVLSLLKHPTHCRYTSSLW